MKKIRKMALLVGLCAMLGAVAGCGERDEQALANELAYRQVGIQKLSDGEYADAVVMFQRALDQSLAEIDDLEIDICYYKAAAQYKNGDVEDAIATYTALIEYDKKNVRAWYLRGTIYQVNGQTEEAAADYAEAIKKAPKDLALHAHVAKNLMKAGLKEQADEVLAKAVKISAKEASEYRELGYVYYLQGDFDSSRKNLDQAVQMGDPEAVFYLAKLEEDAGNTERALQLYESYVTENDSDTVTLNVLGCARMEQGNYEQALIFFRKALEAEKVPNEKELRRNEIAALEYALDFEQAKERMKSYVRDYPDDEAAAREWEFLQSR